MFEMASKECTVVMAIWADSESVYIDIATETLQIPARNSSLNKSKNELKQHGLIKNASFYGVYKLACLKNVSSLSVATKARKSVGFFLSSLKKYSCKHSFLSNINGRLLHAGTT